MASIKYYRRPWYLLLIPVALLALVGIFGIPVFDLDVDADVEIKAGDVSEVIVHPFPEIPSYYKQSMGVSYTGNASVEVNDYRIFVKPHLDAQTGSKIVIDISFSNVSKRVILTIINDLDISVECNKIMRIGDSTDLIIDVPDSCKNQTLEVESPSFVDVVTTSNTRAKIVLKPTVEEDFDLKVALSGTNIVKTIHVTVVNPIDARIIVSDTNPLNGDSISIHLDCNVELKGVVFKASNGSLIVDGHLAIPESSSDGESIMISAYYEGIRIAEKRIAVSNPITEIVLVAAESASPGDTVVIEAMVTPIQRSSEIQWETPSGMASYKSDSKVYIDIPADCEEGMIIKVTADVKGVRKTVQITISDEAAIHIYDVDGLKAIANSPSSHFVLDSDIDASDITSDLGVFTGILDGCGHTISGYSISTSVSDNGKSTGALFENNSGIIRNLAVESSNVQVAPHSLGVENVSYAAVLCAKNTGVIKNVVVRDCTIWGENDDCMKHFVDTYSYYPMYEKDNWKEFCTYDAWSRAENQSQKVYVGGLVAYNAGTISDISVKANISAYLVNLHYADTSKYKAMTYVGMIAGYSETLLAGCSSAGTINQKTILQHAGLDWLGFAEGPIHAVYEPGAYVGCGRSCGNDACMISCSSTVSINTGIYLYVPVYKLFYGAAYDCIFSHIYYTNTSVETFN